VQVVKAGLLQGVTLIQCSDVLELTDERMRRLYASVGGAHLLVAGSPCNNLSGNQIMQGSVNGGVGLEGALSSLFSGVLRAMRVARIVPLAFRKLGVA